MSRVDNWPYEVDDEYTGKGFRFKPVVATIRKAFVNYRANGVLDNDPGYCFEEDDTPNGNYRGIIWNCRGAYDRENKKWLPYNGEVFQVGDRVRVTLLKLGDKGRIASIGPEQYSPAAPSNNHVNVANGSGTPANGFAASPGRTGANNTVQQDKWELRDQQIRIGQAFNNLTALLAAGGEEKFGITANAGVDPFSQWCRWFNEAAAGKPLSPVSDEEPASVQDAADLDAQAKQHLGEESPLVAAAVEKGAVVAGVEDDTEELPW